MYWISSPCMVGVASHTLFSKGFLSFLLNIYSPFFPVLPTCACLSFVEHTAAPCSSFAIIISVNMCDDWLYPLGLEVIQPIDNFTVILSRHKFNKHILCITDAQFVHARIDTDFIVKIYFCASCGFLRFGAAYSAVARQQKCLDYVTKRTLYYCTRYHKSRVKSSALASFLLIRNIFHLQLFPGSRIFSTGGAPAVRRSALAPL